MPPLSPYFSIPPGTSSLSARAPTSSNSTTGIDDRPAISLAYSCLSVIVLATYSSVHPNVPRTRRGEEQEVHFFKQPFVWLWRRLAEFFCDPKLTLFVVALVAPELIFGLAFRQWANAKYLRKTYRFHKRVAWMLVIGGIVVSSGESLTPACSAEPLISASWLELQPYLDQLYAQQSVDVDDKSKATVLSKIILLLQLGWFVVQIVQRLVGGLPLTELESITVAFTAVQLFTGFFWMKKPKDVGEPLWLMPVKMIEKNQDAEVKAEAPKVPEINSPVVHRIPPQRADSAETLIGDDFSDADSASDTTHVSEPESVATSTTTISSSPKSSIGHVLTALIFGTYPRNFWEPTIRKDGCVPIFWSGPWFKSESMDRPQYPRLPSEDEEAIQQALRTAKRHEDATNTAALGLQLLLSVTFGLVHCSALLPSFNVEIPTAIELSMWRICAGLIFILPFLALVLCMLAALLRKGRVRSIVVSMNRVVALVYFSARLFLLVLPFVALRTHPALGPDWKASIPHF
uniref:Uncharacterized protein n=1 Tax=Mycena chlorophos TaxID=658473 RepID=A0ABQ0LIL2_MYCCL|nr:predicted protein [Mycena chlorophos]